jgi:hypothetical protein
MTRFWLAGVLVLSSTAVQAKPAWRGSADLDGDGTADDISIKLVGHGKPDLSGRDTNTRTPLWCGAATCTATIQVGTAKLDVTIHGGYFGGFGAQTIDIDGKDAASELLITQRGEDDEDPPYKFTVITYDGTKLTATPLWISGGYDSGDVKVDGKGKLILLYDDCPDRTLVTYVRKGARIVETTRKTVRAHPAGSCAG